MSDDLVVLQRDWNWADLYLWRIQESSCIQGKVVPAALTLFANSKNLVFQQDDAPCHTVRSIQVWMGEEPQDQDPIMTSPIISSEPRWKPVEYNKGKMDGSCWSSNKDKLLEFVHQEHQEHQELLCQAACELCLMSLLFHQMLISGLIQLFTIRMNFMSFSAIKVSKWQYFICRTWGKCHQLFMEFLKHIPCSIYIYMYVWERMRE